MWPPLTAFLYLLVIHWFADFILQTHWQAVNKSKNNLALLAHVVTYTTFLGCFIPFVFLSTPVWVCFYYTITNGVLHFITDYFTSRWTSKLYLKGDINGNLHNFFVVIGLDQLIHQFTLALTMLYFFY